MGRTQPVEPPPHEVGAPEVHPSGWDDGALPTSLVSRLSGLSIQQLGHWHRTGVLPATLYAGRRGVERLYTWHDYARVLAAAALLAKGLPLRRLRPTIKLLDRDHPDWPHLPLTVMAKQAIVQPSSAHARTVDHPPQGAHFDLIQEAGLDGEAVWAILSADLPDGVNPPDFFEFETINALGRLHEYGHAVSIDPAVLGGVPVVRGTRIETALLFTLRTAGLTVDAIAEDYDLTPSQISCALEFEASLAAASDTAHAPATR